MNHTQGPWEVSDWGKNGWRIFGTEQNRPRHSFAGYNAICERSFSDKHENYTRTDEDTANARLIASAPDLAEALQAILDSVSFGDMGPIHDSGYYLLRADDPIIQRARAAIAKAEGRTP